MGRFPELTSVQRAFPNPFPSAGDITPRSDWTSSSRASRIGRANGEIATEGEATVLSVASGFETSEALVSVGGGQSVTTAVEEGFGEVRLCTKGVYSGIEVPHLVLVLTVMGDISSETPISKFLSCVAEMG